MQELTSSVEMARHVEAPLNHFRHSLGGPQFCAVAIGNGSLKQDPDQPTVLASRESSRTTRREAHLEGSGAASSPSIPPPHDGTGSATDTPSNFVQGTFRAKQFQRAPAPIREQFGRTLWSHGDLLSQEVHYCIILCEVNKKRLAQVFGAAWVAP
jgi:hypothetical protein